MVVLNPSRIVAAAEISVSIVTGLDITLGASIS